MTSLYEKIGGQAAIDQAVEIFYNKVYADNDLKIFFEKISKAQQTKKQKAFLTMAFGGPNAYNGRNMRDAHAKLVQQGLNETHFNKVMMHLGDTLKELNVPAENIQEAANIALSVKDDVLNR